MLDTAPARARANCQTFDVSIASVATAVPANIISQADLKERVRSIYPQYASLESIFDNAGVGTRHLCEPIDWYYAPRTWEERTAVFQLHAMNLLEEVALTAVEGAGLRLDEIDAIVTNTITGLAIPSLDAMLMNRLAFRTNIERLPVFGLGCGGGVGGLSRATRLAHSIPGGNVLFLTVDLCSLCLRINDPRIVMYVALALFGDGAAGVVLRNGAGGTVRAGAPRVAAIGDHFWRGTETIMGWDVLSDGFGIVLSSHLPSVMEEQLAPAVTAFLDHNGLRREDFAGFLLHPGGAKILEVAERVLDLAPDALQPSRATLGRYGNMSSATALFVMKHAIDTGRRGRHLLAAFGPGFSAYFAVVDL